jgi:hypothetical protein
MPKLLSVVPSDKPDKKLDAKFVSDTGREKTVSFGARGMDDYTKTKDTAQRDRYRDRHQKDLQTGDPTRPGFLSYYLLWGAAPSLRANLASYRKRFNL